MARARRRRGGGRGRGGRNTRASEAAAAAAAAAAAEESVPENEETETMDAEETPTPEEPETQVVETAVTSTEEVPAVEAEGEEEAGDVEMAEVPAKAESEATESNDEQQDSAEDQKEETVPQEESDAAANASSSADSAPPSNSSSPTPGTSATASTSKKEKLDKDKELLNRPDCLRNLLTDKEYLIDVSAGFTSDVNLKVPLKGFTADDELQLFPVIESMSAKLYNIVQKMNGEQKASVEAAIKSRRGIIRLPNMLAKAYLCHIKFLEPPGASDKPTGPTKRPPHPFLLTEDENMFSDEKLKMLRAVLDAGWKREVVMRSPGSTGRKTGDVYYYSPDGTKFRSSKQVAQHLAEIKDSPFTIDNYSFAKVRISTNPDQEIVRKAYDGKSPPRSPPKPMITTKMKPPVSKAEAGKTTPKASSSTSKDSLDADMRSVPEEPVKAMSSRRSIQPPKRYSGEVLLLSKRSKGQDDKRNSKGLMQMGMLPPKYPKGMEDSGNLAEGMDYDGIQEEAGGSNSVTELADDSLFQISALRQSGGIDVDNMTRLVENHNKQLAAKSAAEGAPQPEFQQPRTGMAKPGGTSVIPCSIRCPGMQGVIPTLQCTRCLCLYHAECLGLPPNLLFNKYVCSYCTDAPAPGSSQQKQLLMKKQYDAMKRAPPGLAPLMQTGMRPPHPRETMTSPMTGKEVYRLPQKVVVSSHAAPPPPRGMGRARGAAAPHIRPQAPIHSGQRMIVPDGPTIGMVGQGVVKRGRGRPPSVSTARTVPQLNKNLTITHLPKLGSGPPPVPNLQPMGTKSIGKLALPMMGGKPRQVIPSVPNLMKPSAFRLTVPPPSLSGRTFKKMTPGIHSAPSSLRISQPATTVTKIAPTPTHHDRSVSLIKRYPQSIATIGNKKFVVLPKSGTGNAFVPPNMVGNGAIAKTNLAMDGMRNPETTIKKIEAASIRDEQVNSAGDGSPGPQKTVVRNVTATTTTTTTTAVEKPPAENVQEQMTEEPVESNDTTPMEVSTTEAEETKPLEAVVVNQ